jgi:hypothetical protein
MLLLAKAVLLLVLLRAFTCLCTCVLGSFVTERDHHVRLRVTWAPPPDGTRLMFVPCAGVAAQT